MTLVLRKRLIALTISIVMAFCFALPAFAVEDPQPDENALPFGDVYPDDWFYGPVLFVYENGLMVEDDDLFRPYADITRAMVATILYRYEGMPDAKDLDMPFTDAGDEGDYYYDAVKWAAGSGVVRGYGGGLFGPEDNITRQDLATFLHN